MFKNIFFFKSVQVFIYIWDVITCEMYLETKVFFIYVYDNTWKATLLLLNYIGNTLQYGFTLFNNEQYSTSFNNLS